LLRNHRFQEAVTRTFYFTLLGVAGPVLIGTLAALAFSRSFPGRGILRTIFSLPMMATPVSIALIWQMMFHPQLGVLNYLLSLVGIPPQKWVFASTSVIPTLSLVETWQWTPFVMLIVLGGLASLPEEPFEAARIDGASFLQSLWYITIPLLWPYVMVAIILRAIDALKSFDIIYVMTAGGPGFASETLNVYTFQVGLFYFHIGYACSLLMILFALVLGVSLVLIKVRRGSW
jgi:multiple sugar transport system permease protein